MNASTIIVQDCGCIALPDELAQALGMKPGVALSVSVDRSSRSITLISPGLAVDDAPMRLASCSVNA